MASLPPVANALLVPADGRAEEPTFQPAGKGSYFLSLVVTDALGADSEPALVRIDALNNPPVLEELVDLVVVNGEEVSLLARATDADGDALTTTWRLVDSPPGGATQLTGAGQPEVRFTPRFKTLAREPDLCAAGECYRLEVVASDGVSASAPRRVTVVALNRPPIADAGDDQTPRDNIGVLDASGSVDPDGDALQSYTWTQVRGPDVTAGAGSLEGPLHAFEAQVAGIYRFELVVSDGELDSAPDRVEVVVEQINHPPTVSVAATTVRALEGEDFDLDASGSEDTDDDPIGIAWRRVAGNALFPSVLYGPQPELRAPGFEALIDSGDNFATYEVTASDGVFESEPATVQLYALPGPADWCIVSRGAGASGAADCGTVAQPCNTLEAAWTARAGRDVVVTAHTWSKGYIGRTTGWIFPSSVRVVGGRHATDFTTAAHSVLSVDVSDSSGVQLWHRTGLVVERIHLIVSGARHAIRTINSDATFRDCIVDSVESGAIANMEPSDNRTLIFEGCSLRHTCGGTWCQGFFVEAGPGNLIVRDSELEVSATADDTTIYAAYIQAPGSMLFERSTLRVVPSRATGVIGALVRCPGTCHAYSSVFSAAASPTLTGLLLSGETRSILHNNVVVGSNTGPYRSYIGISLAGAGWLMGNHVAQFGLPLALDGAALGARIYGNSFAPEGDSLARCGGESVTELELLNADSGTVCNTSGAAHYGNIEGACPFVDAASYDYRPDTAQANDCVDAGLEESPAGTAPELDIEGNPRPDGVSNLVDIGAYEVQPE